MKNIPTCSLHYNISMKNKLFLIFSLAFSGSICLSLSCCNEKTFSFKFDYNYDLSEILPEDEIANNSDSDNLSYASARISQNNDILSVTKDVYLKNTDYKKAFFADVVNSFLVLYDNYGSDYQAEVTNFDVNNNLKNVSFSIDINIPKFSKKIVYKIKNYQLSYISPGEESTEHSHVYTMWSLYLSPNVALPGHVSYYDRTEIDTSTGKQTYFHSTDKFILTNSYYLSKFMRKNLLPNKYKLISVKYSDATSTSDASPKLNSNAVPGSLVNDVTYYLNSWISDLDYNAKIYSILNPQYFFTNSPSLPTNFDEYFTAKDLLIYVTNQCAIDSLSIPSINDFAIKFSLIEGFVFTQESASYLNYYSKYPLSHSFSHSWIKW